jgi:hypothetical protein
MADYIPNPNFYKDQVKEQEKFKKKLEGASYDTGKRGYTVDGKFYTQAQLNAAVNAVAPKIAALQQEEKREGKYGPAYSKNAKPNAQGIAYQKLLDAAEKIKVKDYQSSVDSLEAWKRVEDFLSTNKDVRVVQNVDAIVNNERGRSVRRAIPALIQIPSDAHGQAVSEAVSLAESYIEKGVVETTRVQTYGKPGAANAAYTNKTNIIDEPVLTARQEEVAAIKNRQAVPSSVKNLARKEPSKTQTAGVTPAVTTPKGSAGTTVGELNPASAADFRRAEGFAPGAKDGIDKKTGTTGNTTGRIGAGLNGGTPTTPTTTTTDTTTTPTVTTPTVNWEIKFREMFPAESWMLDLDRTKYADVFTLFQKSIDDEVYKTPEGLARFKAQLEGTSFVKELASTDMVRQVKSLVGDIFDSTPMNSFLTKAMNMGWKDATLKQEVYKEAFRKDDTGAYVNPTAINRAKVSNDYLNIAKIGKSYFSTVADDTIQSVLTGGMVQGDVERQQRELAKTKYGHLSNLIEQGFTLATISDSYKTQASKILERDPNSIDMSQGAYSTAFDFGEEGKKRMMSTSEWEMKLRSDATFGWDKTQNARDEARALASSISQAFGRVI